MERSRTIVCSVLAAVLWLGVSSSSAASPDAFKIIVQSSNPVSSIDRELLRDIFMRRATRWSGGEAARPIDLPKGLPARDRFATEVLNRTPSQLRVYWLERIFSGTDIPPPEAPSTSAAIAYVVANPGAIAYLPVDVDPGAAKVIVIR